MKISIAILSMVLLAACVQTPTESTQVVDDRPRVTFDPVAVQAKADHYEIVIDGISYGSLSQYLVDENALRIVAGPHVVEVKRDGKVISSEKVVLGENATRIIKVVDHD